MSTSIPHAFVRPTIDKPRPFRRGLLVVSCGLVLAADLVAQSPSSSHSDTPRPGSVAFPAPARSRGRWTFGTQLGVAFENDIAQNLSHIVMLIAQPQVGFRVKDLEPRRFPLRRLEIVSEGILGGAVRPKARVTGYAFLFRLEGKNRGRFVPFLDVGAGVQSTTLYERAPELSGSLQFSPQGGPGIEWFLGPRRALVFQYRYLHMSNAGIELPNLGFNANMLSVGFRWLGRASSPAWQPSRHARNPFHHFRHRD